MRFESKNHQELIDWANKGKKVSLQDLVEILSPYWDECTNHAEGTLPTLKQIHAIAIAKRFDYIHGSVKNRLAMRAYAWKYVFDYGSYGGGKYFNKGIHKPEDVYLNYPWSAAGKLAPNNYSFGFMLCDKDLEVLNKNLKRATGEIVKGGDFNVEALCDLMENLRTRLKRRVLVKTLGEKPYSTYNIVEKWA